MQRSKPPCAKRVDVPILFPCQQTSSIHGLWSTSSEVYRRVDKLLRELANPNLHDIANMNHRVELWTADSQQVRWAVAATASVTVGHAAFEAAMQNWPNEHFTLRNGILVIREHPKKSSR
jgi:hypothetical protein